MPTAASTRRSARARAEQNIQSDAAPSASSKEKMGPKAKRSRGFEPETPAQSEGNNEGTIDVQAVHAVSQTLEDLRDIITCKICFRLLYVPFTAQCGHTFCYSCLCSWLTDHGIRKTCPDCRSHITSQPAPSYIVREMTQRIISHPELLPEGDTVEKHQQQSQEEARLLERHKADPDPHTGGMFKGIFKKSLQLASRIQSGIRDESDNVTRCPVCLWQLEDGMCEHCGWGDEDYVDFEDDETLSSSDDDSSEESEYGFGAPTRRALGQTDEDLDDDFYDAEADATLRAVLGTDDAHMHGTDDSGDSDGVDGSNERSDLILQRALRESRRLAGIPSSPSGSNGHSSNGGGGSPSGFYDPESDYDSEEDEDMDSFIDDEPIEEEGEEASSDYESTTEGNTTPRRIESTEQRLQLQPPAERRSQTTSTSQLASGAGRRRGMPIVIDSDSESDEPQSEPQSEPMVSQSPSTSVVTNEHTNGWDSSSEEEEAPRRARRRTGRSTRR